MHILHAVPLLMLLADPEPAWEKAAETDGITVYTRQRQGSEVREVKAQGIVAAAPERVWKVIRDFEAYPKTMPYITECKVIEQEQDGKVSYVYTLVKAPFVSRRDFTIRVVDESDWKGGQGFMKSAWTMVTDKGPAPRDGVVRLKVNDGYWLLEPRDGGVKTMMTYYVFTDPGGAVPKWMVNHANGTSVPDVFRSVRKESSKN